MKTTDLYLTEWTDKDFNKVNKAIQKYFGGKTLTNHRGKKVYFPNNFYEIEKILGLPYTSTSICPMMSMDCNVGIFPNSDNSYHFGYVVLNKDLQVVLVLQNGEEKEKYIICK